MRIHRLAAGWRQRRDQKRVDGLKSLCHYRTDSKAVLEQVTKAYDNRKGAWGGGAVSGK